MSLYSFGCSRGVTQLFIHSRYRLYRKDAKVDYSTLRRICGIQESRRINIRQNYSRFTAETTNGVIRMGQNTMVQKSWLSVEDVDQKLMSVWPDVVRDLTSTERYPDIPEVTKWLETVLEYNVPGGKHCRTLPLLNTYRMMIPPEQLTEENIRLVCIVAWSLELLESFILLTDDIQDRSLTRRKRPCWYLHNDIGLAAINDALLLENAAYDLLRIHLKGKDYYIDVLEALQECHYESLMGQRLDQLLSYCGNKTSLQDLFTVDQYSVLAKTKLGSYLFRPVIRIAMCLAGLRDPEVHKQIKPILLELSVYSQVQNDYLDCYGDPSVTGKIGTDIQEGKCTWLIVVALEHATPEQRKILDDCYGSKDPEKIKLVKRVYDDIGLSDKYWIYEKETYNLLISRIKQLSYGIPNNIFRNLLEQIRRENNSGFF